MSDVNFRRCRCTVNKDVCRRRVENGVRDSVDSVTRALRLRLKEHVCSRRCENVSGLGACGYDRDKVDSMSVDQLRQLKKIHHVKWEFIPGCIDTSDLLYHPDERKRRRMTRGQTRNIKYQLCFHAHGMDREVASVFCNPETYCDCRKDALKQLVKTVQFYMGFVRGPGGEPPGPRSAQTQYWPTVDQIKHWKSLLAGFGKPPEWYATIWARTWCRPLRALVPGDSDAARLQQLSDYIRAFFNETPVDHFVPAQPAVETPETDTVACARVVHDHLGRLQTAVHSVFAQKCAASKHDIKQMHDAWFRSGLDHQFHALRERMVLIPLDSWHSI